MGYTFTKRDKGRLKSRQQQEMEKSMNKKFMHRTVKYKGIKRLDPVIVADSSLYHAYIIVSNDEKINY